MNHIKKFELDPFNGCKCAENKYGWPFLLMIEPWRCGELLSVFCHCRYTGSFSLFPSSCAWTLCFIGTADESPGFNSVYSIKYKWLAPLRHNITTAAVWYICIYIFFFLFSLAGGGVTAAFYHVELNHLRVDWAVHKAENKTILKPVVNRSNLF